MTPVLIRHGGFVKAAYTSNNPAGGLRPELSTDASRPDENLVAPVWEHIRCFMEENGGHLPQNAEVADELPPATLWASLGAVGPFGSEYFKWWREHKILTSFYHLLAPVTVPMFALWGLLNWLSYRTAVKIDWPEEVLTAVR